MMKVRALAAASLMMLQVGEAAEACWDVQGSDAYVELLAGAPVASKKCAINMVWAKMTGIKTQPQFYTKFANLDASSSYGDFQCALWKNRADGNPNTSHSETGHYCMEPCKAQTLKLKDGGAQICKGNTAATSTPATITTDANASKPDGGGSWPWYAWFLLILGICCGLPCLGLLCSAFLCYESIACLFGKAAKPAKKKRSTKKTAETAAPPAAPLATPVATTAIPMPVYTAQMPPTTSVTTAPPVYLQAAPAPSVSYAAPAFTYAAPAASVSYAAPAVTYAAPTASISYPAAAPAMTYNPHAVGPVMAFDMIDANHDGQISRQEMAAALG
jgi:hypothetical protein